MQVRWGKITTSNQVFSCYSSHKKINWEGILINATYTDINLGLVVQKVDKAIHQINIYPVDSAIGFPNSYPLDSDLSGG